MKVTATVYGVGGKRLSLSQFGGPVRLEDGTQIGRIDWAHSNPQGDIEVIMEITDSLVVAALTATEGLSFG